MSVFDGTYEELTYGEALVEIATRVSWPTEAHANEALRAVRKEFGLLPPEPEPAPGEVDPRDAQLAKMEKLLMEQAALLEQATTPATPTQT